MIDASSPSTQMAETAQKLGEQLVSAVKLSQHTTLDAARAIVEAWSSVAPSPGDFPGAGLLPDVTAITAYGFDLAAELLAAQKDFALSLAASWTSDNSA